MNYPPYQYSDSIPPVRNNQIRLQQQQQQELQQQLQQQDPLYQTRLTTFRAMQPDEGTLKKQLQRPQPGKIKGKKMRL